MIRRSRTLALLMSASAVGLLLAPGCFGGGGGGGGAAGDAGSQDPAEAFTNALDFGGQATPTVGDLPEGTAESPSVTPLPGTEPMQVIPGNMIDFQIPWQGGEITGINIGFGGGKFFKIPVAAAQGKTSGMVNVSAQLGANVCASLGDICHQIACYEQVTLPDGTISKAAAMQLVLNCTGGQDCSGNTGGAGGGGGSGGGTGACGDPSFPIDCGTFCCSAATPVCGTGTCCGTDQKPCAEGCCPAGGTCPPTTPEDCATCCPGDSCCTGDLYCCGDCDTGC